MVAHCSTLQHSVNLCNTHCNTMQYAATIYPQEVEEQPIHNYQVSTHCNNTLQHTATHCNTLQHLTHTYQVATHYNNTLQHTATHCNTPQHTATTHPQPPGRCLMKSFKKACQQNTVSQQTYLTFHFAKFCISLCKILSNVMPLNLLLLGTLFNTIVFS